MKLVFSSTFTGVLGLELRLSDLHGKCFLSHLISSPPTFFLCMYVCVQVQVNTCTWGGGYKSQVFLPAQVLPIRLNLQMKLEWVGREHGRHPPISTFPELGLQVCATGSVSTGPWDSISGSHTCTLGMVLSLQPSGGLFYFLFF